MESDQSHIFPLALFKSNILPNLKSNPIPNYFHCREVNNSLSQSLGSSSKYHNFFPQNSEDGQIVTQVDHNPSKIFCSSSTCRDFFPQSSQDEDKVTQVISKPSPIVGSSIKCYDFFPQSSQQEEKVVHFLPSNNDMIYKAVPKEETSRLVQEKNRSNHSANSEKRNLYQEACSIVQESSCNKQLVISYSDVPEQLEMFDKLFLCPEMNPHLQDTSETSRALLQAKNKLLQRASSGGRPRGKKKAAKKMEVVDLRSLLLHCSQAVTNNQISEANELLKEIRKHSSPYGDSIERLAHFFSNAIDARLAGTGTSLHREAFSSAKITTVHILKSYEAYSKACPFLKMTTLFANKSIWKLIEGRKAIHIIDFGILHGIQWPCMIQCLSLLPGVPTKLRITGIDLPQPGFRPAERLEETGRLLANYSKRFNLPFEYIAIAKKWENIQIEDLKIDRDEMLVVNSMYRLRSVPDETVVESRPRDAVLNLIKKINPDVFVLGVLNGKYSAPFFHTRFREALFHFSALFDMFEVTTPREDKDRFLFEQEVFGRDVMNVIACEGTCRIERPETYKKWQERNIKVGFRQLPLYQDIVQEVTEKVKLNYHKDFVVDEDSNWMLLGWKGRVLFALSLWKPGAK